MGKKVIGVFAPNLYISNQIANYVENQFSCKTFQGPNADKALEGSKKK